MPAPFKHAVERALVATGVCELANRIHRRRILVLAYHNIVPRGEPSVGERTLHLSQVAFAEQLDQLAEQFEVVPLIDAFTRDDHTHRRARVVITWDDAYAGAVGAGVEEVVRRGLPATIFVAPGRLDGHAFWWDRVAEAFDGAIPSSLRERALDVACGRDEGAAAMAAHAAAPEDIPDYARSATAATIRAAASRPEITIGSHSWSHANLSRLTYEEVLEELTRTKSWLHAEIPSAIPWLAYPYGRTSPTVSAAMKNVGLDGGLLVQGGWTQAAPLERFAVPRLTVPGSVSIEGFLLRVAGLIGG